MESTVVRSERRGRKRKRKDVQDASVEEHPKKQVVAARSKVLVGRYVKKEFKGIGVFLGKVVSYDTGLYRIDYEDGDCEDLESGELKDFLLEDDHFNDDLLERKKKLGELISKKYSKTKDVAVENVAQLAVDTERVVASSFGELSNGGNNGINELDVDADSSSDSCEYARDLCDEITGFLPPQLPPSSGNIGVPEEYISHLFSVYGFLRSFSIRLFLSPFGLDDFVGSLNCSVPNTLLDSVHVALMRALRRHFETLSSNGSDLASKCLRCMDWSLLDTLTWPVYLVQYLLVLGHTDGHEWAGFYVDALERDYYTLSVARKLTILQILCDDVLESEEVRAEIDMREESEVGTYSDSVTVVAPEYGPKRVHPRYSKTSACKDQEAMKIISESHETNSCMSSSLGLKGTGHDADADVDQDGNGDECRLCGMDGILLCCDGCPSAYHARCIGVTKMYIPEGKWYCPECTTDKIGPTITKGTSLRGAENFGIDPYGQVFLGTCNHLLVLKFSINSEPCLRYYNQADIPSVLRALNSSAQHIAIYSGICSGILQYWAIPENVLSFAATAEMAIGLANKKEDGESCTPLLATLGKERQKVSEMVETQNFVSCVTESSLDKAVSCIEDRHKEPRVNRSLLDTMAHPEHLGGQRNSDTTPKQVYSLATLPKHIKVESSMSAVLGTQHVIPSDLIQQSFVGKSIPVENATCMSGNSNGSYRGNLNSISVAANISSQCREPNNGVSGRGYKNSAHDCLYMGSSFKYQAYINNYIHGDFAASAAANLAVLSSQENRVLEPHASNNRRKVMSANISLQVKAFSSAAIRFFWPTEKKLYEVPRERCSWCLSCKAPATSKRGCLLNAAVSNATKVATKILAGFRPVKSGDGSLPGIAAYVMFMEESLCGLAIGPFLSPAYRKQWCKQVEHATTFNAIKTRLLELEENIRSIALSKDWCKLVDNWSVESSATQSAVSGTGSTQKRGPSGRRGRRPSTTTEVTTDDSKNVTNLPWWRGGMLSKLIFQKGTLPRSMVNTAARQGGSRKISGIYYAEGSEVPKRSRRLLWRAAVEMSRNASQLALQVRYLDLHVRWNDLVCPEPSVQDGKGPDAEASAFRNASIFDKKSVEDKIRYAVAFGNQKHLPSRVMKNIIEIERSQDGKEKYWFCETFIPLYLIKEYEENTGKALLPPAGRPVCVLSKLQRRQLKANRKDIFSYLSMKRDNTDKCCCASCQLDVVLGMAVKCSACEGYCHEQCIVSSTNFMNEEVEFLINCKRCYHSKALTRTENVNESPTIPSLLQGQEFQNAVTVTKGGRQIGSNRSLASAETFKHSSKMKPDNDLSLSKKRSKIRSWGLIWKKPNCEDTGIDFRLKNVLLKGNPNVDGSRPVCHLCKRQYDSNLMYVHCETCKNWYHAEAVQLEESKILELVGFKCCRCRRIKSPECPYDDKNLSEGKKPRTRAPKQGISGMDVGSETISERHKVGEPAMLVLPTKGEVVYVPEDRRLRFSLSKVEQFTEHNSEADLERITATVSGPGPQKLTVRRHMKCKKDVDCSLANSGSHIELSTPIKGNISNPAAEALPHVEWDISTNGFEDHTMFDNGGLNCEDMEFEPQTYFSFTELLASGDSDQLDGVDTSGDVTGNWENKSALTRDGILDDTYNQQESAVNVVPCKFCSCTEPFPDLSCEICELWMHSHCSPWIEHSSWEGKWRCGNCREWR